MIDSENNADFLSGAIFLQIAKPIDKSDKSRVALMKISTDENLQSFYDNSWKSSKHQEQMIESIKFLLLRHGCKPIQNRRIAKLNTTDYSHVSRLFSSIAIDYAFEVAATHEFDQTEPSHFTDPDHSHISQLIRHLKWPQRMTLTRLSLDTTAAWLCISEIRTILTYRNWLAFVRWG